LTSHCLRVYEALPVSSSSRTSLGRRCSHLPLKDRGRVGVAERFGRIVVSFGPPRSRPPVFGSRSGCYHEPPLVKGDIHLIIDCPLIS